MRNKLGFPSLRQLRAFEAVARLNSIGAAARELGLSQSAVTQMVAQMETPWRRACSSVGGTERI
jgi:molybdenum-dependent DNA-binding transcriptional regulator ModE